MKLRAISEQEFNSYDGSRQVIADEYAHKFAALDSGGNLGSYGLSWNSELIDPVLELSPDGLSAWVGVNQYLAAISLSTGRICLALTLHTNLVQILIADSFTAVLTETEILLVNPNFSIRLEEGFPDIASEILFVSDTLEIRLLEGTSLILDTQTGTISGSELAWLSW